MDETQKQLLIDKLAKTWTYQGIAWYAPPPRRATRSEPHASARVI